MSNYRPIYGKQLWSNDAFVSVSTEAKIVYFYLLTNPESEITGIQKVRIGRIASDCNLDAEVVHEALLELLGNDLIVYNVETKFVYIYRYFHFAKGTIKNPSVLAKCIQRQKELALDNDSWELFEYEYPEELLSINKSLMNHQSNKNKNEAKNKNRDDSSDN